MNPAPMVSVLIAAYQAEAFVARSVESALGQSLQDLEVIVVDDGSPDRTADRAQAAGAGDTRLRILRLARNGGVGAARNAGLGVARGAYVAIRDADDTMRPDRLQRMCAFAHLSGAAAVFDNLVRVRPDGSEVPLLSVPEHVEARRIDLAAFARGNKFAAGPGSLGYLQPLLSREFLERHALRYDPRLRIAEDYLLMADVLAYGGPAYIVGLRGYRYTMHDASASRRMRPEDFDSIVRADLEFERRHGHRLDARQRAAIVARRESYMDAGAFERAIDCLKQRDPMAALSALLARPGRACAFGSRLQSGCA